MAIPSLSEINFARMADCPHALVVIQTGRDSFLCAYRDDGPDLCGLRENARWINAEAWIEQASRAGLTVERHRATDLGPDGVQQYVLYGAERASPADIAKRKALAPLKPKTAQRACDIGLFSDEADQLDLCEMFQDHPEDGL